MCSSRILLKAYGFSLVEVMLSLLIFMIIALGLARMEIATLREQSANMLRDEALRLAQDELNRLRGERFTLTGTSGALTQAAWSAPLNINAVIRGNQTTFFRSVQITDLATSAVPLKRIDVAVGWTQGNSPVLLAPTNQNHQTSLSSIIVRGE